MLLWRYIEYLKKAANISNKSEFQHPSIIYLINFNYLSLSIYLDLVPWYVLHKQCMVMSLAFYCDLTSFVDRFYDCVLNKL